MTLSTRDTEHPVTIPGKDFNFDGILHIPKNTTGIVLFVHGSGSNRPSTRYYIFICDHPIVKSTAPHFTNRFLD